MTPVRSLRHVCASARYCGNRMSRWSWWRMSTQGVSVLGEVRSPGSFPLLGRHRVIDFITLAGGLTASASRTVTLTHPDSATPVVIHLDSDLRGADSADAALRPGDRIVVVKAGTVYVLGDVGRPGGYLIDSRNSISVLQGLALAQGVNRTAKDHASLIRNTAAGPEQEPLDLKKILANQVPTRHCMTATSCTFR